MNQDAKTKTEYRQKREMGVNVAFNSFEAANSRIMRRAMAGKTNMKKLQKNPPLTRL